MGAVKVYLLGSPRIECDGQPLVIHRRKAIALLGFLAVTGRPHRRESLAALLSPDADPVHAHAYLRNAVWELRRKMGAGRIATEAETIALPAAADLWIDLLEFRRLLDLASSAPASSHDPLALLEQAVAMYKGPLMGGFHLRDNLAFEEWQLQEEETWQAAFGKALERLAGLHEDRSNLERAIEVTRRRLSLDPLDESVQRKLMVLHARAGKRAAALDLSARSARRLEKDLGLRPAAETLELRRQIAAGTFSLKPAPERAERSRAKSGRPPPALRLPAPRTPFVGRESELEQVGRFFDRDGGRLLSLVGPGGCGKSRLALEAARRRAASYTHGAVFVPLASVRDPQFIVAAIVEALNAWLPDQASPLPAGRAAGERGRMLLGDYLSGKRMLLVLDNMEHLLAGAGVISAILARAPLLHVLVTSRERCHLRDEVVIDLAGLPVPRTDLPVERLRDHGAVELFLQGARRARAGFEGDEDDLRAAIRICRAVDGNPLAIELASSWVRTLTCAEIDRQIAVNFDFLSFRDPGLPPRHRSLRAVFGQSWTLLSASERELFRRLSVFAGGFDHEAATAATGSTLETLTALADKSLIRQRADGRFEIHEVLRQYAAEELARDAAEERRLRRAVASHYLERLRVQTAALAGPGQKAGLEALAADVENLRSAWLHGAREGWTDELRSAALGLFLFYDMRSRFIEGAEMCRQAVALLTAAEAHAPPFAEAGADRGRASPESAGLAETGREKEGRRLHALLLGFEAWFRRHQSPAEAADLFHRAIESLADDGHDWDEAFVTLLAYNTCSAWGLGCARLKLEEVLSIFRAARDRWSTAMVLDSLAFAVCRGERDTARRYAHESFRIRLRLGDVWGMALSLYLLGRIAEDAHLPHVARRRFQESIRLRRRMGGDSDGIVTCLLRIAHVDRVQGRFREAARCYRRCRLLSQETGNQLRAAHAMARTGLALGEMGRHRRARNELEAAHASARRLGFEPGIAVSLGILANVALADDQPDEARRHLAAIPAGFPDAGISPALVRKLYEEENMHAPLNPWLPLARGRLAAIEGRAERAREHLERALALALRGEDEPTALEAIVELAELAEGRESGRHARLWRQIAAHPAATWVVRRRRTSLEGERRPNAPDAPGSVAELAASLLPAVHGGPG